MAVVAHIAGTLAPVIDLVYPPRCPSCGAPIAVQAGLCTDCWELLDAPVDAFDPGLKMSVHAATHYNETSRKLVLAYKHGGRIALARLMARMIAAQLPDPRSTNLPPLLVPVPLHRWRLWQRGFNQAALLARELAMLGKGELMVDALRRHMRTPSLGGLGREERESVLRGAIALDPARAARIAGREVILVDDVLTSGATCRACEAALAEATPASVSLACFARVDHNASEANVFCASA